MLIGLDVGTSVVKAVAFDRAGEVLATAGRPTRTLVPAAGRAEQDPEAVAAAVGAVLREVVAAAAAGGSGPPELVGITAQGDGVWLLDEGGRPVRPAILWSDARAAAIVGGWLAAGVVEAAFRRSGNVVFPGAAAPLLAALASEEPEALAAAATAGYCKDFLVQRLTGARATDVSDASLPFLDPRTRRYDEGLLAAYGVAPLRRLLAPIDPTPGPLRPMTEAGALLTGLPVGTPVHAGPFDLCATLLGAGVARPGDGLVILGTTLGCGVLTEELDFGGPPAGMTLCLHDPGRWVRVMPAMVGTPSLEWALGLVGAGRGDLEALLAETAPGAGGVVVLPHLSPAGERAPFVDPAARGQIVGLSLATGAGDLVRAVCEGIAYAARQCLEAAGLAVAGEVAICGGGAQSAAWRQILADVLQRPLRIARQPEVGARGAALAAQAAAGWAVDVGGWTRPEGVVEPRRELAGVYEAGYAFYEERLAAARGRWGPG